VRLLADRHGVRTLLGDDPEVRRDFDARRRELRIWRGLSERRREVQLAVQWAHLEHADVLERLADVPGLSSDESRALARIGLANYYAAALVLPYSAFLEAAEATGYDVGLLGSRFGVSVETVCHRLSTLQRPGAAGVPFVFLRVDRAGNISKRHSATEFHLSRIGGNCPLWNVHDAFSAPGRFITQVAEMPNGRTSFWVATTVGRPAAAFAAPGVEFAVALGCDVRHARRLVYSRGLDLEDPGAAVPIGPGCRLCERADCHQRAFPLVGRPLDVRPDRPRTPPYPAR
jgi:predicted transcriptional regulator